MQSPSFSPYPFDRLRRVSRREAQIESAIARWLHGNPPTFTKLVKLAMGPVKLRVIGSSPSIDPHASLAEVRANGISIFVAAPSRPIRALAQQWIGGPDELDAPRPLTPTEHGVWCLVIAAALADHAIAADVWPAFDKAMPVVASTESATIVARRPLAAGHPRARDAFAPTLAAPRDADTIAIELGLLLGNVEMSVAVFVPAALELRVPPPRALPGWLFDIPIVLGRAAVPREDLARLAVRDTVTIERTLELALEGGSIHLTAAPRAVEATVATGYVPRDMALPDDAHLELTVQLGTTRMSLRALEGLAVGQVISLGRPLAGPFDVRAGGRLVGQGELIDIDGELGVRIVSLAQE